MGSNPAKRSRAEGQIAVGYGERFKTLLQMSANGLKLRKALRVIPTRVVKSLEKAVVHYRELLAAGKEGTIIKNGGAT